MKPRDRQRFSEDISNLLRGKRFTALSRSHIHQLKNKLQSLSKKSQPMEAYLQQFKDISDQIALVTTPIDDEDLILLVLNGLPDEYNSFKTAIRARSGAVTMEEVSSLLCSEAIHIEKINLHSSPNVAFSAVQGTSSAPQTLSSPYPSTQGLQHFQSGPNRSNFSTYRGNHSNSRGRGRFTNFSHYRGHRGSGLVCQICGKNNHTALECRNRMSPAYTPAMNPVYIPAYPLSYGSVSGSPTQGNNSMSFFYPGVSSPSTASSSSSSPSLSTLQSFFWPSPTVASISSSDSSSLSTLPISSAQSSSPSTSSSSSYPSLAAHPGIHLTIPILLHPPPSSFNTHPMITRSKATSSLCLSASLSPSLAEPTSYKEALQSPHWLPQTRT
ncbi:putative protein TPRXL [Camellia sinensis]|uniref:putative protein TPRXL n=1 Tax=Camellia sinensis TaxID=4442 RepID=UPI001036331F|nr:putative protein TPRXL [Camellia sinensis]